ncbi:hypothetical protein SNE40_006193 [Patella caerulea]|uniref:HYR domain-containing protein n=1 Tax=Patella caerulea TaxID=87958 RepID=A0AAN8K245_PATCE
MAVSVYKVVILLVLLISPVTGLKNNKFIEDMIYDVMVKPQRDHGCQLKATTTRALIEWCKIPTGLNTTELKDDFLSFPQNTKCALKMDNSSVVCKGCYENRWYKTSCNHDPYVHRQKRFIGWIIAGIIALAVACAFFCPRGGNDKVEPYRPPSISRTKPYRPTSIFASKGPNPAVVKRPKPTGKDRKRNTPVVEPYRPPSISCTGPSEKRIYASKGSNTAVVKWPKPTGKDGKGNTLNPKRTDGKGDTGSSFGQGHHTIGYHVTDTRGFKDYCSFTFEVAVHVCKQVQQPDNGKKDCGGVEMIWGKYYKL